MRNVPACALRHWTIRCSMFVSAHCPCSRSRCCTHAVREQTEGRRPKDRSLTKGSDSKLPGWQPKEKATQLPQEGELSKQRGWHQCTKGRGPKDPRTVLSRTQVAGRRGATQSRSLRPAYRHLEPPAVGPLRVLQGNRRTLQRLTVGRKALGPSCLSSTSLFPRPKTTSRAQLM